MWSLPTYFILILLPALWEDILVFFQSLLIFKWWQNSKMLELHGLSNTSPVWAASGPGPPFAPWDSGSLTPGGWGGGGWTCCHSKITLSQAERSPGPGDLRAGWAEKLWDVHPLTHPEERQGTHFLHVQPDKPAEAMLPCRGNASLQGLRPVHFWPALKIAIKSNLDGLVFKKKILKIRRKHS